MQSSVYSKLLQRGYKNHHGEVLVVVQEKKKKKLNTYNTNSKTKQNKNKKQKINWILNQAPCICAWVLAPL